MLSINRCEYPTYKLINVVLGVYNWHVLDHVIHLSVKKNISAGHWFMQSLKSYFFVVHVEKLEIDVLVALNSHLVVAEYLLHSNFYKNEIIP